MGPPVWRRRIVTRRLNARWAGQDEMVYLVPCHHFDIAPAMTVEELADEGLVEHRWWSVAELAATADDLRPAHLATMVEQILEHGAPAEPLLIEEFPDR
jgi:uncharacterized protein YodC (DUF2158 family)